ncbi:hypothetical protein CP49_41160 [Bradyrhizobium valentinum]|uniref:Uncharacterized protein n=1 Tax=Bradyrhizobium valentinum TaxID=1518501 RepID=A0A0R3L8F2_9BRAD|nr:hypothetical protein CP49_41160 [Bradyrhizobium valentinum]
MDAHAHSVDAKSLQAIQKVVFESVWRALDRNLTFPASFWKCSVEGGEKLAELMLSQQGRRAAAEIDTYNLSISEVFSISRDVLCQSNNIRLPLRRFLAHCKKERAVSAAIAAEWDMDIDVDLLSTASLLNDISYAEWLRKSPIRSLGRITIDVGWQLLFRHSCSKKFQTIHDLTR